MIFKLVLLTTTEAPSVLRQKGAFFFECCAHSTQNPLESVSLCYTAMGFIDAVRCTLWTGQNLEDNRLDIANNACQRAIRPFAVGSRNWLFLGNVKGAKTTGTVYSLTETCKANNVDAYRYLIHALQETTTTPQKDLTSLLPWNCNLSA